MDPTRAQLEAELAELDALIPELKADYPHEADFWPAFACLADAIGERVGESHCQWWSEQLDRLMARHHIDSGWPAEA
jgi:hypothetical protein